MIEEHQWRRADVFTFLYPLCPQSFEGICLWYRQTVCRLNHMILFSNGVIVPRLIYPMFDDLFVGFSCLVEIYPECLVIFLSRDDEEIGVFYYVFIVEFTVVNLKIDVLDAVVSFVEWRCIYSCREMIERCHDRWLVYLKRVCKFCLVKLFLSF